MSITKGLIIDRPHIGRILSGDKTWEMRTTRTQQRGRIALIQKSSGTVIGTADLVDCIGPLTREELLQNLSKHLAGVDLVVRGDIDKWKFAWVMRDPKLFARPVSYRHPSGAVIWVNLQPEVSQAIARE